MTNKILPKILSFLFLSAFLSPPVLAQQTQADREKAEQQAAQQAVADLFGSTDNSAATGGVSTGANAAGGIKGSKTSATGSTASTGASSELNTHYPVSIDLSSLKARGAQKDTAYVLVRDLRSLGLNVRSRPGGAVSIVNDAVTLTYRINQKQAMLNDVSTLLNAPPVLLADAENTIFPLKSLLKLKCGYQPLEAPGNWRKYLVQCGDKDQMVIQTFKF